MRPVATLGVAPLLITTTTSKPKNGLGAKRAKLATGRRVLRRSFHVLASLGPDAIAPV